jgi:GNAT superfamily N-acetyltransferase
MIRPARAHESAAVRDIVHAAYEHYIQRIGKPPGPMLDDYAKRIADRQTWVAEDAGRLVAILVLEDSRDGLLLDNIAVHPSCQGKGYGRALIVFAEMEAKCRGYGKIDLYTHMLMTENIALYQHMGFVEIHRATEKGYDRIYMTKQLR